MPAVRFFERCPRVRGFFGRHVPHPGFVAVTCDGCGREGYVPEHDARAAFDPDDELLCSDCST